MPEIAPHLWVADDGLDQAMCARIISAFDSSPERIPSHVYNSSNAAVRRGEVLLVSDLPGGNVFAPLITQVFETALLSAAIEDEGLNSICNEPRDWTEPRAERVPPGGGFVWHMDTRHRGDDRRILTAILYLNELAGGELEFRRTAVEVKPRPGRVVLFPPFWTHVHRGKPPLNEAKYAVGAFLYVTKADEDGRFIPK